MTPRMESIVNSIQQLVDDAYDDGYGGGYDEGWDAFGENHTDPLVRKGEDQLAKEFLEEFPGFIVSTTIAIIISIVD